MSESAASDKRLVILTGASGSGKTTIAERCAALYPDLVAVRHFDAAGVPSRDEMIAGHGSLEEWQRQNTLTRLRKLADIDARNVLFEGQSRIAFLTEAISAAGIGTAKIILVDCDDATRWRRLREDRGQAELANEEMRSWAAFLRKEARDGGYDILDTSKLSVDEGAASIRRHFD